ncbi:MAG: phosphoribosylformylglycinamidine cyclo-ligase [Bacteroidota bacterium]
MSDSKKKSFTYKDAGVDIEAGEQMVDSIKEDVKSTHTKNVLANIGGFGGLFEADFGDYDNPVLVSSVDGVGTKLIVAFKAERYDTVGQDLVNHCTNDIAVCGAQPLFFLDYFSTGKLSPEVGRDVVKGFAKACRENGIALVGGETAEMPDIYSEGEFDLAGTIVGVVEKDELIDGSKVGKGDVLLGFASNGIHTNGYSLARKVLFSEYDVNDDIDELDGTLADELLRVHKSYLPLISKLKTHTGIHAFSHVTGGGIIGNTKRVVPEGSGIDVNWDAWERPAIFKLIQKLGNVPEEDMRRTFNLGIGLIAVVAEDQVDAVSKAAAELGETAIPMGQID